MVGLVVDDHKQCAVWKLLQVGPCADSLDRDSCFNFRRIISFLSRSFRRCPGTTSGRQHEQADEQCLWEGHVCSPKTKAVAESGLYSRRPVVIAMAKGKQPGSRRNRPWRKGGNRSRGIVARETWDLNQLDIQSARKPKVFLSPDFVVFPESEPWESVADCRDRNSGRHRQPDMNGYFV